MKHLSWIASVLLALFVVPNVAASYEKPVQRPSCDAADPGTKIISQPSDFNAINSSQYRIFCVRPGDYSSMSIELSADGTQAQPRYLVYDAPSGDTPTETHPVKMNSAQRASFEGLTFDNANWWVVQGLFIDGGQRLEPDGSGIDFLNSSSNNVVDRVVVQHGGGSLVQLEHGSSDNTVQNSVIRETDSDPARPNKDYHCVHIKGDKPGTTGNRLVRNEIYDCAGDAIHMSGCPYWLPDAYQRDYDCDINEKGSRFWGDTRGTIIYDNDVYLTNDFKNVCGGSCGCTENAIDIKSTVGQTDRAAITEHDWVRIEKNRIWNNCNGGGDAIIAHFANSDYVLVRHNVIQNWTTAYRPTIKPDPFVDHHSVIGNVFADVDSMSIVSKVARDIEYYKNTVVRVSDGGNNLAGYGDSEHLDLQCNAFIDAGGWSFPESRAHSDWNTFYATPSYGSGPNNQSFGSVADANMQELCIERKIWTGPETHCIADAKPTDTSPHVGYCPANLGSYNNVGVHDRSDPDFFSWYHEASSPPDPRPDDWRFSPIEHFGNFDNFEPIDLQRWDISRIGADRRLFLEATSYDSRGDLPGEIAVAKDRQLADFDLSMDVKTGEDLTQNNSADFVVVFAYEDASNYYLLLGHQAAEFTKLARVEAGQRSTVAEIDASMVPDDAWHTIRLVNRSGQVRVDFDAQTVWSGSIDALPQGRIGVGSFDESVYFDNIDATAPTPTHADAGAHTGPDDTGVADAGTDAAGGDDTGANTSDIGRGADSHATDAPTGSMSLGGQSGCASTGPSGPLSPVTWLVILVGLARFRTRREYTNA